MALIASDLITTIKKLVDSYVEEIGSTAEQQETYLFAYINNALRELASVAYQKKESDALLIASDGYKTFQRASQDIADMYSPLLILDPNGKEIPMRRSFTGSKGWYKEATNTRFHFKGFSLTERPLPSGEYTLQYIAYPATVGANTSPVEFPDAGAMGLCYYVAALILESLPDGQEMASRFYELSNLRRKVTVQANIDGRGVSSGGFVPSISSVDTVFRG